MAALAMGLSTVSAAPKAAPAPFTADGEKHLAQYKETLTVLQGAITKALPQIDAKKRDAFLKAHAAVDSARPQLNTNPAFIQAQTDALNAARSILADAKGFLDSEKFYACLVKCAVIAEAMPQGLAQFAQQGLEQAKLVDRLLADDELMKQMLLAGGAKGGKYGEAMRIYTDIKKASTRAGKYALTARVVTVNMDPHMLLTVNGAKWPIDIACPMPSAGGKTPSRWRSPWSRAPTR